MTPDAAMSSTSAQTLQRLLAKPLDYEELRTLCLDLKVDFDSLRGKGKAGKARELMACLQRQDRLSELATYIGHFL